MDRPTLTTYSFTDLTRRIPALSDQAEQNERPLELWLWSGAYTGYGDERPLLFLAHGGGGHPEKFDAFARAVADEDILVAAVTFPMTNQYAPVDIVYGIADTSNQPGDVSASLDWLFEAVNNREHELYGTFSPNQVAYLGHSLGGQTGLALSRYDCCKEDRINAWILAAPFLLLNDSLFPEHAGPIPNDGPQTVLLHGQDDTVAPVDDTLAFYDRIRAPKAYVGLSETEHSEYLETQDDPALPSRKLAQELTLAVLADWISQQQDASNKPYKKPRRTTTIYASSGSQQALACVLLLSRLSRRSIMASIFAWFFTNRAIAESG